MASQITQHFTRTKGPPQATTYKIIDKQSNDNFIGGMMGIQSELIQWSMSHLPLKQIT